MPHDATSSPATADTAPATARDQTDDAKSATVGSPDMNVWMVGQQVSPTQRRGRYEPATFGHPAKMLPELARRIVETYSREGNTVVDLMSGIGTTGVESIWLNRNYVGVEIEHEYYAIQKANLDLAKSQGALGQWSLNVGDAQDDFGIREVDLVTFSPPYHDAIHNQGNELERIKKKIASGSASQALVRRFANWNESTEQAAAGTRSKGYSSNVTNIGHQKGDTFRASMSQIYARAFASLRPGGYLAVVTKDQRDRKTGELTDVYGDTVKACKDAGFQLHQHIVAILCKVDENSGKITPRTSHWQRIAVNKSLGTDRVILLGQFEDVAVFRKPAL
nr:class I SAM-dependent methyltransferase [Salinibacterium sp. UTAS2018]